MITLGLLECPSIGQKQFCPEEFLDLFQKDNLCKMLYIIFIKYYTEVVAMFPKCSETALPTEIPLMFLYSNAYANLVML